MKIIRHWIYLGGGFGGGRWAFRGEDGRDDTAMYREFSVLLGYELVRKQTSWKVEVGYLFGRFIYVTIELFVLISENLQSIGRLQFEVRYDVVQRELFKPDNLVRGNFCFRDSVRWNCHSRQVPPSHGMYRLEQRR